MVTNILQQTISINVKQSEKSKLNKIIQKNQQYNVYKWKTQQNDIIKTAK